MSGEHLKFAIPGAVLFASGYLVFFLAVFVLVSVAPSYPYSDQPEMIMIGGIGSVVGVTLLLIGLFLLIKGMSVYVPANWPGHLVENLQKTKIALTITAVILTIVAISYAVIDAVSWTLFFMLISLICYFFLALISSVLNKWERNTKNPKIINGPMGVNGA